MLKTLFVILTVLFGLAACQKPPENNPNARLAPVSFEQDFEFDPEKEQQFDFYVSRWEEKNQGFTISLELWLPKEANEVADDKIWKYFREISKYWAEENHVDILPFEIYLEHHQIDKKIINVPLEAVIFSSPVNPPDFVLQGTIYEQRQDKSKNEYRVGRYDMASFFLGSIENGKQGFYRLKIRSLRKLKLDYDIKAKVKINYPFNYK